MIDKELQRGDAVAQQLGRLWSFTWSTVSYVTATQVVLADGNHWRKPGTRGGDARSYRLVGEQSTRYGNSHLSRLLAGEEAMRFLVDRYMVDVRRQADRSSTGESPVAALQRLVDVLAKGAAAVREGAEKTGNADVLVLARQLEKLAETQGLTPPSTER